MTFPLSIYCAFGAKFEPPLLKYIKRSILREKKRRWRYPWKQNEYFRSTRWFIAPLIYFRVPRYRCRFPRSAFWSAKMNRRRGLCAAWPWGFSKQGKPLKGSTSFTSGSQTSFRLLASHLQYESKRPQQQASSQPNQTVFPTYSVNMLSGKLRIQLLDVNVFINYSFC